MPTLDLRHFLGVLQKSGELTSIGDQVDLRYELGEFPPQDDRAQGPALKFESIKGHPMNVVGNLVGTKKRLALAFGLKSEEKLLETYRKRRGGGRQTASRQRRPGQRGRAARQTSRPKFPADSDLSRTGCRPVYHLRHTHL
jgi:3-polyprenyl-4-hydroxybenzoate decarboxylase